MGRIVDYEITASERPGYFDLYRIVGTTDGQVRTLIDQRCSREPLEWAIVLWRQPGGWSNFF